MASGEITITISAVQHLYIMWYILTGFCFANPDAKRLYDDLLSNYNKLVRPVANVSDALTVKIKLKLSQLIDVVRRFHFIITRMSYLRRLQHDPS